MVNYMYPMTKIVYTMYQLHFLQSIQEHINKKTIVLQRVSCEISFYYSQHSIILFTSGSSGFTIIVDVDESVINGIPLCESLLIAFSGISPHAIAAGVSTSRISLFSSLLYHSEPSEAVYQGDGEIDMFLDRGDGSQ